MSENHSTDLFGQPMETAEQARRRKAKERKKLRYHTDPVHRAAMLAKNRIRYQNSLEMRKQRSEANREYRKTHKLSEVAKERRKNRARERYNADPEFRERRRRCKREAAKRKTPEQREQRKIRVRARYQGNDETRKKIQANNDQWLDRSRLRAMALRAAGRALRRGLSFDRGFLFELAESKPPTCNCCGRALNYKFVRTGKKGAKPDAPSLDRVDSTKGYVRGNVSVVCCRCNILKRDGTVPEFEKIVRYMRANLGSVDT